MRPPFLFFISLTLLHPCTHEKQFESNTVMFTNGIYPECLCSSQCAIGAGFLASPLLGIFSGLLELAGIGLIIASLIRINNHPEKYKGKKMATALLIIIGIFTIPCIISLVFPSNYF